METVTIKRGECPHCHRRIALRPKDGGLRPHHTKIPGGVPCPHGGERRRWNKTTLRAESEIYLPVLGSVRDEVHRVDRNGDQAAPLYEVPRKAEAA